MRLLGEVLQQGIHTYDVDQARKRTTLCETREEAAPTLLNPLQHQSRLRLEHGHDEVVEEFRQARRAQAVVVCQFEPAAATLPSNLSNATETACQMSK